ncbi:MAG: hypothetical protein HY818_05445 [Acetobacterium woodii]|nr:hypothetical protein [Acetobacterium woodii]
MNVNLTVNDKEYTLKKLPPKKYKRFRDMLSKVGDMDLFGANNYTDEALDEVFMVVSNLFNGELSVEEIEENSDISDLIAFVREVQFDIEKGAADRINKMYQDFFQKSAEALAQKTSNNS